MDVEATGLETVLPALAAKMAMAQDEEVTPRNHNYTHRTLVKNPSSYDLLWHQGAAAAADAFLAN